MGSELIIRALADEAGSRTRVRGRCMFLGVDRRGLTAGPLASAGEPEQTLVAAAWRPRLFSVHRL